MVGNGNGNQYGDYERIRRYYYGRYGTLAYLPPFTPHIPKEDQTRPNQHLYFPDALSDHALL